MEDWGKVRERLKITSDEEKLIKLEKETIEVRINASEDQKLNDVKNKVLRK